MKKLLLSISIALFAFSANAQWLPQVTPNLESRGIDDIMIVDSNSVWATEYDGTGSGVYIRDFMRTQDGGATWFLDSVEELNGTGMVISMMKPVTDSIAWICTWHEQASDACRVLRTNDAGQNWFDQTIGYTASSFPNVIHFWDTLVGFTMGDPVSTDFEIFTTADGGTTWTKVGASSIPNKLSGEYGYTGVYHANNAGHAWFATNKGRVFRSFNYGATWAVATSGLSDLNGIYFENDTVGYAWLSSSSSLVKTENAGANWSAVGYNGNFYTNGIAKVNAQVPYLMSVGADAAAPAMGTTVSFDGGVNWYDVEADGQRTAVAFYNAAYGWAGGFSGGPETEGGISYWDSTFNSIILGRIEALANKEVVMFPNPANDNLTINFPEVKGKELTISFVNALGQTVKTEKITSVSNVSKKFNLSDLESGVYFVTATDGHKSCTTKLIKN